MSDHYMTLDDCAKRAAVSRHTVNDWIKNCGMPCIIFSERLKRVPVAEFDAWMREYLRVTGSLKAAVRDVEQVIERVRAYR